MNEAQVPVARTSRMGWLALSLAAGAALLWGWWTFWFLTDDAYIAFRYISNAQLGYGYSWNPPPFRPVEGYTSFAWVVLLDVIWRVTGVDPPRSANVVSLAASLWTLLLALRMLRELHLSPALERWRGPLAVLAILSVLTNRTFLAWTSSGLETALFNALLTSWVFGLLFWERPTGRSEATLASLAALLALTRPDGLLFAALTALALVARWWIERARSASPSSRSGMLALGLRLGPLALIALHLLWRYGTYGQWLPNTYFAKSVAAWPEAGARYLGSFILEYGLWAWLVVALTWIVRRSPRALRGWRHAPANAIGPLTVGLALFGQLFYYTLMIGGDHFEFRVYSHIVPLIAVAAVALSSSLGLSGRTASGILCVLLLVSWPIQWTHWIRSQERLTRPQTFRMKVPVADALPLPLRPLGAAFDAWQSWLIDHAVCMRHQEHKQFALFFAKRFPPREVGAQLRATAGSEDFPVLAISSVGIPGWMLPHVAIIDRNGLNDFVIARTPIPSRAKRLMAHDRAPPPGYLECFEPNVEAAEGAATARPRAIPLTATQIVACEQRMWSTAAAEIAVPSPLE